VANQKSLRLHAAMKGCVAMKYGCGEATQHGFNQAVAFDFWFTNSWGGANQLTKDCDQKN